MKKGHIFLLFTKVGGGGTAPVPRPCPHSALLISFEIHCFEGL